MSNAFQGPTNECHPVFDSGGCSLKLTIHSFGAGIKNVCIPYTFIIITL
jgi:hypothetical protein